MVAPTSGARRSQHGYIWYNCSTCKKGWRRISINRLWPSQPCEMLVKKRGKTNWVPSAQTGLVSCQSRVLAITRSALAVNPPLQLSHEPRGLNFNIVKSLFVEEFITVLNRSCRSCPAEPLPSRTFVLFQYSRISQNVESSSTC